MVTSGKVMNPQIVTFEELDREHRREVARDEERLRNGEISPQALQEENSIFPMNAEYKIVDLIGYATRVYLNQ